MEHGESRFQKPAPDTGRANKLKHRVLDPDERFGNFQVVKCLCAGLVANYYHMRHIRDFRDVTVGILHDQTGKDPQLLRRLLTLQKTLKNVEHEGIPKISDCTRIEEQLCIILEPVGGQSLSQYFQANAAPGQSGIGLEASTRILAQLLGLLGYAHSQGIDHRDLDTDMILIQEDGSLRVLGLGIKAALGTQVFDSIVSASVSPLVSNNLPHRLNSFDVMSPEYKQGITEDFRVDIFCAGTIGYWLLTGRKASRNQLELPSTLVSELSAQWDVFFKGLLEQSQEQRYQSCRVALHALKDSGAKHDSERAGFIQRQIDRIPVPRYILERGEFATRVYRLSLIGIVGITLTALTAFFVKVSFMPEVDYRKDVAQLAAAGQHPHLVVQVSPAVCKLEFSGFNTSFITNNGRLALRVVQGEYKLRVSAPQHVEQVAMVTIGSRNKDLPQTIFFELLPAWSDLQIRSEPLANVSVIDASGAKTELGTTDSDGEFSLQQGLVAGIYQVIVTKQGYEPAMLQDQELIQGEVSVIEAPLTPLPASLTIRTRPSGASIRLNNTEVGISPVVLDAIAPADQYLVEAQLPRYRPAQQHVAVKPGQDVVVDLSDLVLKTAELELAATFAGLTEEEAQPLLPDIRVMLGDQSYPFGAAELKYIPEGSYTVQLEHPRYVSTARTIRLQDQQVQQLSFTLTPRPAQVRLILPPALQPQIRINQKSIRWENDWIELPANQPVEFQLQIKDHLSMVRTFNLQPSEQFVWDVQPVPIPGPVLGQDWAMPWLGFEFAWIPQGSFRMGSPIQEQGRLPNEGEQTEVTFTQGFWAGVHEVTQSGFREIMDQMPAEFSGLKHPVDCVSWQLAQAFCEALTAREAAAGRLPAGYVYRLPTEAEWEYAARSGSSTPFHFGERADTSYGNFRGVYPRQFESGQSSTDSYGTEPVGSYAPNDFGLYDVHGNVSEWTLDAYNGRLPGGRLTDPQPRTGGGRYTLRGGSWQDFAVRVRSAARSEASSTTASNAIGFRIFLAPVNEQR